MIAAAQRQAFADRGLVDLDRRDAGGFEVGDLVAQGQSDLHRGVAARLVVADERPLQDRHRAGEHALDHAPGERLLDSRQDTCVGTGAGFQNAPALSHVTGSAGCRVWARNAIRVP